MESRDDPSAATDRTLALLWRAQAGEPGSRRGPKQRVSVDDVVRTAIAVADAEGLASFSVRKVAERLGIGAMSVYTYVPGRAELIGLMVDDALGDAELGPNEGSLRERVTAIARQVWDSRHRHPWLLHVDSARPWIGPHGMALYEWQLAAIDGLGFTDLEMDQVVTLLTGTAESAARASIGSRTARSESGISDLEWWEVNAPLLERFLRAEDYPLASRVGTTAGEEYNAVSDPERSLDFALGLVVEGLEQLLARHRRGS